MSDSNRYLLRVEGVNLGNVIDDTDQLSVRRGGGLMILNAATELKDLLPAEIGERLQPIATGASIALFEFEANGTTNEVADEDAETVRVAVERFLRRDGNLKYHKLLSDDRFEESRLPLRHGTYVVDVVRVGDQPDVQQAEQLATAKNRWRQLQQPTLSLDGLWDEGVKNPCDLDRTRVGNSNETLNDDKKNVPVSNTAFNRWHYGRGARQRFYERELEQAANDNPTFAQILATAKFTNELKDLSQRPPEQSDDENSSGVATLPDNVVDKLAIFYVDGNKFGQKGRDIFSEQGADGFREWSRALRTHHQKLLKGLLELTEKSPQLWKNGDAIRLETLLWGGDEILWVVPAWLGWEVARWFFSQPHQVQVGDQTHDLTYGCGLVFCHMKAPIKNTSALAHKLGDLAKQARSGHSLAYEVLESFDDISGDLEAHRQRFLPLSAKTSSLVIDPSLLDTHWRTLVDIANCPDFPMRQLYMLCNNWRKGNDVEQHEDRLKRACSDSGIEIDGLITALGDPVGWLHLLQMMPYLPTKEMTDHEGQK